jgi:hypothetical protein
MYMGDTPLIRTPEHPAVKVTSDVLDKVDRAVDELRQQGRYGIDALDMALAYVAGTLDLSVPGIAHLRGLYETRRRALASAAQDANLRRRHPA